MLLLRLTDGKVTAKAVEFKPFSRVEQDKLPPGSKVVISNASVKAGVILLDDRSIQALSCRMCALQCLPCTSQVMPLPTALLPS